MRHGGRSKKKRDMPGDHCCERSVPVCACKDLLQLLALSAMTFSLRLHTAYLVRSASSEPKYRRHRLSYNTVYMVYGTVYTALYEYVDSTSFAEEPIYVFFLFEYSF